MAKQLHIGRPKIKAILGDDYGRFTKRMDAPRHSKTAKTVYLVKPSLKTEGRLKNVVSYYGEPLACQICGTASWYGAKPAATLLIGHISGNHKDNNPANLRVVCRNCNDILKTKHRLAPLDTGPVDPKKTNVFTSEAEMLKARCFKDRIVAQKTASQKKRMVANKFSLDELVAGKAKGYNPCRIFDRLISEGLVKPVCARCGIKNWRGISMTWLLHCHHHDHDPTNNKLTNLKMLCGNCHRLEHTEGHSSIASSVTPVTPKALNENHARSKGLEAYRNYKPDHVYTVRTKEALDNRMPGETLTKLRIRFGLSKNTFKRIAKTFWPELWTPNNDTYLKGGKKRCKNKKLLNLSFAVFWFFASLLRKGAVVGGSFFP